MIERNGYFIAVDANIGAGKTNACHAIASVPKSQGIATEVFEEPVNHELFPHFLQNYYEDLQDGENRGAAYIMQTFMLSLRFEQHKLAVEKSWGRKGHYIIQDRPIYGDTVFAKTAMEEKVMSKEEYDLYQHLYRNMSRDIMPPDLFVYLHVDPEECHRRMVERSRTQESSVPLSYLQHLEENYKIMLNHMKQRGVKVLTIDWNNFGPPVVVWEKIKDMINGFKVEDSLFKSLGRNNYENHIN